MSRNPTESSSSFPHDAVQAIVRPPTLTLEDRILKLILAYSRQIWAAIALLAVIVAWTR